MSSQPERTIIFGTRRGDTVYAVRARGCPAGVTAISKVVSVSGDQEDCESAVLRAIGAHKSEPFIYVDMVPMVYGSAISLRIPRVDESHPVVRDIREILQHAEWEAGNTVREAATEFFDCNLQDIVPCRTFIERLRETVHEVAVTVLHVCKPDWDTEETSSSDVRIMPLLLSTMVGKLEQPEAIIWIDEDRTVVVCRRQHVLREIRTIACGLSDIRECIEEEISCSDAESSELLEKWEEKKLPHDLTDLLRDAVSSAGELFSGALHTVLSGIPERERPVRCVVSGPYPLVSSQVLLPSCRGRSLSINKNKIETYGEGGGIVWARAVLEQAVAGIFRSELDSSYHAKRRMANNIAR